MDDLLRAVAIRITPSASEVVELRAEVARLRAVLRWTHDTYCFADYGKHAPECLLCELGEEETTE